MGNENLSDLTDTVDKALEYSARGTKPLKAWEADDEVGDSGFLHVNIPDVEWDDTFHDHPYHDPNHSYHKKKQQLTLEHFPDAIHLEDYQRTMITRLMKNPDIDFDYIKDLIKDLIKTQELATITNPMVFGYGGGGYGGFGFDSFFAGIPNLPNIEPEKIDPNLEELRKLFGFFPDNIWEEIKNENDIIQEIKEIPTVLKKYFDYERLIIEEDDGIKIKFITETKGDDGLRLYDLFYDNYFLNINKNTFDRIMVLPEFIWKGSIA